MTYTGPVFRPPFEANSLLLEVTVGCSHNACTFCTMYRGTQFRVSPMEQIEKDLLEAKRNYGSVRRIFLVNADPFVLSARQLKAIAEKINEVFPDVETIAMYASVKNIIGKTDEELRQLRELKINELNIGIESGLDEVLHHLNKGFTLEEARTQLKRLGDAGIDFSANIIIGAGGMEKSMEHAAASAALLNEVKPYLIFLATLHVDEGSPLYEEKKAGGFVENTLGQNIAEEIEFLKKLKLDGTAFFGLHTSNVIPVSGTLPQDQEKLIARLERGMASIPQRVLDSRPEKGYEGMALID
jgi:radical SAM superfamily enzyme YgiQ (UPF0313 family)